MNEAPTPGGGDRPPLLCAALLERFEPRAELGRGGMGVVYRAFDRQRGHEVALKVLLAAQLSETQRARFLREGQVTAALVHPGIVRLYECGAVEGQPFLSYELIPGARGLREAALERPFWERVRLVRDAARALGEAHRQGVVHRDVKPENLLVSSEGRLRVTDFGLAALEGGERLTKTGALVGTPYYMSPEQYAGAKRAEVDARSDVWALGVCLYEVLAGEVPFAGESLYQIGAAISSGTYPPLAGAAPGAPRALEDVVARALAPDAAQRYPEGESLAADLDRLLDAEHVAAGRNRRWGPALLGGGLAALVLGLGALALAYTPEAAALSPAPSAAPDRPSPSQALGALERARAALAAGQLEAALTAVEGAPGPAAQVLRAELLLRARRFEEARRQIQALPEPERPRLEAARLLLAERDPAGALALLSDPQREDERLTRVLAQLLVDSRVRLEIPRAWIPRRDALAFARAEVERFNAESRDPSVFMNQVGELKDEVCESRVALLERAAKPDLWEGHLLEPALKVGIQEALFSLCMFHFMVWGTDSYRRDEWFACVQRGVDLAPTSDAALRLRRLAHALRFALRGRELSTSVESALRGAPAGDPRVERPSLPVLDRWLQLCVSFLSAPTRARLPLAREALGLTFVQTEVSARLRREVCLVVGRLERGAAYEAFLAGDAVEGRAALARAREVSAQALEPIVYWKQNGGDRLFPRDYEEGGVVALMAGDVAGARGHFARLKDEVLRGLYLAECDLAAGDAQAASRRALPLVKSGKARAFPELYFLFVELSQSLERPVDPTQLFEQAPPDALAPRLPWRTLEGTRLLLAGEGWRPRVPPGGR